MLTALIINHLSVLGGNPVFMRTMVEKGMLGRKAGKGFYLYPKEAKKSSKEKQLNPEVRSLIENRQMVIRVFSWSASYDRVVSISSIFFTLICHRDVVGGCNVEGDARRC